MGKKHNEKVLKYSPLIDRMKRRRSSGVDLIPVIVGATGAVTRSLGPALARLGVKEIELTWLQRISALGTCTILRRLIGGGRHRKTAPIEQ